MHRCLKIEEIIKEIFLVALEEECPQTGTRFSQKSRTVAGLARTCKAFRGPALALLWRKVFGIAQLFSVLPAAKLKWEEASYRCFVIKLAQPPTSGEWDTFFEYCALVKHLHLHHGYFTVPGHSQRQVDVDIGILSAIPSDRTIFPSLQTLNLTWEGRGLPLYHLFLPPTLQSFALTLSARDYDPILHGFLQKVKNHSQRIRSITFKNTNHDGRIGYIPCLPLKDAIMNITELAEISALHVDFPPQTFNVVSGEALYNNLRVLEIGHTNADIDSWFPPGILEFPKLSKFVLLSPEGPNLDKIEEFFSRCSCPLLEVLDVQILGATPPEQSLRSFFNCIAAGRDIHSKLRRVSLTQNSKKPDYRALEAQEMKLDLGTLKPLLLLGIYELELDIPSYFALEDSDHHEIANSWVGLQSLTLGQPSSLRQFQPNATFASLAYFSSLCPRLETLNIQFLPLFTKDVPWDKLVKNESVLKNLYVYHSEIPRGFGKVAAFLSGLFPELTCVESVPGKQYSSLHKSWTEVNSLLPVFAKVRQQEHLKVKNA
ncbi:hypothetical protein BKA70DRAFT_1515052 [Coprinopsis sp. MPI-PUGE-AT-0042]|nr:hypothetical protein BKA70DRAFT_1515052 [Coprinopsis sp. MPI-PUGE-AT-0042]